MNDSGFWKRLTAQLVFGVFTVFLLCNAAMASVSDELSELGFGVKEVSMRCELLNRDVTIQILVPDSYRWNDETYSTLYLLDSRPGDKLAAAVSASVIQRDDVLPVLIVRLPAELADVPAIPSDGEGPGWAQFLETSVFPYVEKTYRVIPFRVLAGDLLNSEMALTIATARPDLVQGIIAEQATGTGITDGMVDRAVAAFSRKDIHQLTVCVAASRGSEALPAFTRIAKELGGNSSPSVRFVVQNVDVAADQKEAGLLLYKGLEYVFGDWYIQQNLTDLGLKGIEKHYEKLSKLTGADVPVPQEVINRLAREYLNAGEYVDMTKALKYNTKRHENSAKAYAALAQGWDINYKVRLAVINYKKALKIAKKTGHPSAPMYRKLLDNANQRLVNDNYSKTKLIQNPQSNKLIFGTQNYSVF